MIIGISRILRLIVITACCVYNLQAGVGTEPYLGWSFVEEGDVVVLGGTYKWSGILFHYNASGGGTSQKPGSGIWEIPSHSYNGKPLVAIRDYSFEYWDGVEGFIIPSTVTNLSPLAFCGELIEGATVSYWTGLSSVTSLVFKGNAPDVKGDLKWALPSSTVYVTVSSSGWGVEIPGQWKGLPIKYLPQSYSVKFNANGGSGTMANQSFDYGVSKNLTANRFSRNGYSFAGWAISASGAKVYSDKQSVSNLTKESGGIVNLYAVWEALPTPSSISVLSAKQRYPWNGMVDLIFKITGDNGTKYNIYFTAKDLVGGTNVAMKTIRKSDGTTATAKESLEPGTYNWIWDAAADLPKDFECERMTITGSADVSVYTVRFYANGGTGTMTNQSFTYGTSKALTANAFSRTGYTFQGWATSAKGGKVYSDKQVVKDLTTTSGAVVNLYAVWEVALYMVIDLSSGANSSGYPVSYIDAVPNGGWTDEYKTTKLVMRRIEAGTFILGSNQTNESLRITLTNPFYCGCFEVTQKQYLLIMGSNPSCYKGDMRPVENVNYNTIRGSSNGAKYPSSLLVDATSVLGKLRSKTGLDIELPTEFQWEYACRANTTTPFNNGGDTNQDLNMLGRYLNNQSDGKGGYSDHTTTVGSYEPNAWGLYDMHANVMEWCLNWGGDFVIDSYVDPKGPSSGTKRSARSGAWWRDVSYCKSSSRFSRVPSDDNVEAGYGFRLICGAAE